jgi:hypothetical protein
MGIRKTPLSRIWYPPSNPEITRAMIDILHCSFSHDIPMFLFEDNWQDYLRVYLS